MGLGLTAAQLGVTAGIGAVGGAIVPIGTRMQGQDFDPGSLVKPFAIGTAMAVVIGAISGSSERATLGIGYITKPGYTDAKMVSELKNMGKGALMGGVTATFLGAALLGSYVTDNLLGG